MDTPLPALRADLEVIPQIRRGKPAGFVIKDPATQQVFDVEEEEYFICQQLDGQTPLPVIQQRYENRFGSSLPAEDLDGFIRQLRTENLLSGDSSSEKTSELTALFDIEEWRPTVRFQLFNPDPFFSVLYSLAPWLFSRVSQICQGLLLALAAYVLLVFGGRLWDAMITQTVPSYWALVQFYFGWIFLVEVPRCLVRGLFIKHYGLPADRFIVIMIYRVFPMLWIQFSNRWAVRDKMKLFLIAGAGFYTQLLICALSIVAWKLTTPGTSTNSFWLFLLAACGLRLIVHDANPLVKLDAYNMLVIWLGVSRLRERAMPAALTWLLRRPPPEPLTAQERRGFLIYGSLALLWSVGFLTFLLSNFGSKLTTLFQAPGAALVVLLVIYLLPRPLKRYLTKPLRPLLANEAGFATRWFVRLGWLVVLAIIMFIPYPYETGGTVGILPNVQTEVHCEIDGGRIDRVFVREGGDVTARQPLAQIDPSEYEKNFQATQAQLENTEAKLRQLRRQLAILDKPPDIEEIQGLEAEVRRLKTLVADYKRQFELTTLRAPVQGRVTTPQIEQKAGQYLKKGELFATIEQAETVQAEVQVPEQDVPLVALGAKVKVALWAYPNKVFDGTVRDIAPIAATPAGSPDRSVRVIAELPNKELLLKSQLTGYAKIRTKNMPVGLVLWRPLIRWFQVQFWYWLP
jgi:putative peptide zinc metalloprotease protein